MILDGLKAGETIVVEGLQKVREGAPVQPMTAAQMEQAASDKAAAPHAAPDTSAKPAKE
jgi:membrane fusion protein (multidrug efflux system)